MKTKTGYETNGNYIKFKSGFTGEWCVETESGREHFKTEKEAEETLGVTFEFSKTPLEITDFGTFVSLLTLGYYLPSYKQLIERHRSRTICIPCAEYPSLNFEASVEERQRLAAIGRKAADDYFKAIANPTIKRRHSVY